MDQTDDAPDQSDMNRNGASESRDDRRGDVKRQEQGAGKPGERSSNGISNRGMSESEEQADLPSRGSTDREDATRQSER